MQLDTSNRTYRQLMGNGLLYRVPPFQRDYSWEENHWEDLYDDIATTLNSEVDAPHYMGYLVLQTKDNKHFDVIDGQQRLCTLSIIVLAVMGLLDDLVAQRIDTQKNTERISQLRSNYLGYIDVVTLISQSKLILNRNNNGLYQDYLVPLKDPPKRGLTASNHLMRKARDYFTHKINSDYSGDGGALAGFIDRIADQLFFTTIIVGYDVNAYTIFETLNARGVQLSSTDLLKNYLFSIVDQQSNFHSEIAEIDRQWASLVGGVGGEKLPDYLRSYWNSAQAFVRHPQLFKQVKLNVENRGDVFTLIRNLVDSAIVYAALPNPGDRLWTPGQAKQIAILKTLSIKQVYPLLLAAHKKLDDQDFERLLAACVVISLRYNVIGGRASNEQERLYSKVAIAITNSELTSFEDILAKFRPIYPSDRQFKHAFAEKTLRTPNGRNRKIVRYILFEIERHVSGVAHDKDSDRYTIEHVMPESLGDEWLETSDRDHQDHLYRIGNMTLMDKKKNQGIGNQSFDSKRPFLSSSEFAITKRIAEENSEWTPERISTQQSWLAKQATAIWRIPQLSDS